MKGSLLTSSTLHAAIIAAALVSLGSPEKLEAVNTEYLPVEIVPIEELTQIQQGDKKADLKEKAAPTPTKKETPVQDAQNAGDNEVDLNKVPMPGERPRDIETAAAPEKADKAVQTPDSKPEEVKQDESASEPSTEVAALPEAKQEVKPDPKPDAKPVEEVPAETPEAEAEIVPEKVPVPAVKPKVEQAQAQTAKTNDRKQEEKKKQEKATSLNDSDFNADEISALLNKEKADASGAKRSQETAALGGKKTTGGSKLSMSEEAALRSLIEQSWNVPAGMADAADVVVKITFQLDQSGNVIGDPDVVATGGTETARRAMAGSVKRAIMKAQSQFLAVLPADKFDAWQNNTFTFNASEMM